MPLRESAPVGAPCWADIFTSDPDRTRAFYGELFGWQSTEPNADFGGYFNFTKDDRLIAGGMRNDGSSGAPDLWSIYLAVEDAPASVAVAAAHGSEIEVPAMPVGDLGSMAVVHDAGNARIGMWQPGTHKGFGIIGEPGTPGWFELHTRDYDAAVAYYRDVFGWDTHTVSESPEFRYTTLGEGEGQLAGIMDANDWLPAGVPAHWSVYFATDDTDKSLARIVDLGGAIVDPAQDTPYGRLATATDSTGAQFKLVANT